MTITIIKPSTADWTKIGDDADKQYLHAEDLAKKGTNWKAITKLTGVGYSSGWLFVTRRAFAESDQLVDLTGLSVTQAANKIRDLRLGEGQQSWGELAARTGLPESQVRKLFTQVTNVDHQGLRNGHGGRHFQGNAEAYLPAPKIGWVRPQGEGTRIPMEIVARMVSCGAIAQADADELKGMSLKELRKMAQMLNIPQAGAKDELIARVAEAYAA